MKTFKLLMFFCFISASLFVQDPKAIDADLLKTFRRIEYWDKKNTGGQIEAVDSLAEANDLFNKKLQLYTGRYAFTLTDPFTELKKERVDIFTAADGLFRIYSWDTRMGGTMRDFANVMQYKAGDQIKSILLESSEDTSVPFYSNLYTFKTGGKTYYLGVYGTISSSKDAGTGIQVFGIENGKLNSDVKLIKTTSGLHSKIYYDYDFFSVVNIAYRARPTITFDAVTQTIRVPLVAAGGKVTSKFITYKYNGQYFEKVKS